MHQGLALARFLHAEIKVQERLFPGLYFFRLSLRPSQKRVNFAEFIN